MSGTAVFPPPPQTTPTPQPPSGPRWRAWLAAAVAAAMVGAGGAVAYYELRGTSTPTPSPSPSGQTPTQTPSGQTPTTTPTQSPTAPSQQVLPVWPFTSAAQVTAWQRAYRENGSQPWHLDAGLTAKQFVAAIGFPELSIVTRVGVVGSRAAVTLGYRAESGRTLSATTVLLTRLGTSEPRAWSVTGARTGAALLSIRSPAAGATVRSPLTVSGLITGVDESLHVAVRTAFGLEPLGETFVGSGGQATPWTLHVRYATPHARVGVVYAWLTSAVNGNAYRLVVVPVRFGDVAAQSLPSTVVVATGGRIALVHSSDGSLVRYLAPPAPGGGDSLPQLAPDGTVYFLRGGGTCQADIVRTPPSGGVHTVLSRAGAIYRYGVSADGTRAAYAWQDCASDRSWFVVTNLVTGGRVTRTPLGPDLAVVGNPVWSPDGTLTVLVEANGATQLRSFDPRTQNLADAGDIGCPTATPCGFGPAAYDAAGRLTFTVTHGGSATVMRLTGGTLSTLFTAPQTPVVSLDVNLAGDAVVFVTSADEGTTFTLWRWWRGSVARISTRLAAESATW